MVIFKTIKKVHFTYELQTIKVDGILWGKINSLTTSEYIKVNSNVCPIADVSYIKINKLCDVKCGLGGISGFCNVTLYKGDC